MESILEVDRPPEGEMTLNKDDRKWVTGEIKGSLSIFQESIQKAVEGGIATALDILKPKGWRQARENILAFGSPVAICALIVALLGVTVGALYQSFSHVKEETAFRTHTDDRLSGIESSLLVLRTERAAANPKNLQSQAEARDILLTAKRHSAPLPLQVVERAGQSFIEASRSEPKAWDVGLQFISYRTTLNGDVAPRIENPTPADKATFTHIIGNGSPEGLSILRFGTVPINIAARYEPFEEPVITDRTTGSRFLVVENHPPTNLLELDGMHIRNVIFRNATLGYSGGPVALENVYFVNCTFKMKLSPESEKLGTMILAAAPTEFRSTTKL